MLMEDLPPFADLVRLEELTLPDGMLALRHTASIPASLAQVWQAWTTSDGLMTFAAPLVHLDFRLQGIWESSYNPKSTLGNPANIQNEILAYLPMEMLTIRIHRTPPGFPDPEMAQRLWTVIRLRSRDDSTTEVELTMLGYQPGDESSPVYQMFRRGNALTLGWLHQRFVSGPRHWE